MAKAKVKLGHLRTVDRPWAATYEATIEEAQALSWALQAEGIVARVLRGSKMTTLGDFFDEIGAALQFPAYFGENWDALDECLTDMLWLRGHAYVLIVADADRLFRSDELDSLPTLLAVAERAGERWAAPTDEDKPWGHGSVPFHIIFQVQPTEAAGWRRRVASFVREAPMVDFGRTGR
jgi:hypothetical protein